MWASLPPRACGPRGGPGPSAAARATTHLPWSHDRAPVLGPQHPAPAFRTGPGPPPAAFGLVPPGLPGTRTRTAGRLVIRSGCPVYRWPRRRRSMWANAVPMPRTRTGRHDTTVVTGHGARTIPAGASGGRRFARPCPARTSRSPATWRTAGSGRRPRGRGPARRAARTRRRPRRRPGRVMAVSGCNAGQMPGSGETSPNPVFCAMPTHPDHTSAAAGAARTSNGQDRAGLGSRRMARQR
jgi:hypothetical protein